LAQEIVGVFYRHPSVPLLSFLVEVNIMPRMVAFLGLGCSIALAGATCQQENALSMVQMNVQKQLNKMPADDDSEEEPISNVTEDTTLDKAMIKEIVKDVVEKIIGDTTGDTAHDPTVDTAVNAALSTTEGADIACQHNMEGEYEDQKSGNIITVNQTGCSVNVDMMWDESTGRVLKQGTVEADSVTISDFDEQGEFTEEGDIIFPDGGYWKKFPDGLAQLVNANVVDSKDDFENERAAEASANATSVSAGVTGWNPSSSGANASSAGVGANASSAVGANASSASASSWNASSSPGASANASSASASSWNASSSPGASANASSASASSWNDSSSPGASANASSASASV